jgi:hypothetical protein
MFRLCTAGCFYRVQLHNLLYSVQKPLAGLKEILSPDCSSEIYDSNE